MKYFIRFFSILFFMFSCKPSVNKIEKTASPVIDSFYLDEGVSIEYFDSLNTDPLRQTHDNIIYTLGREFTFDYVHLDTLGDSLYYNFATFKKRYWEYVAKEALDTSSTTVKTITLTVDLNNKTEDLIAQTFIKYTYKNAEGEPIENRWTGVVENKKNIWLHPPREQGFKVLEMTPFPYVKKPLKLGSSWNDKLEIGAGWGDSRWCEWDGIITNKSVYEVTDKVSLNTVYGSLKCWVIEAVGKSELGTTKLVAYFNEKIGFVKLVYTTINKNRLIFNLKSIQKAE